MCAVGLLAASYLSYKRKRVLKSVVLFLLSFSFHKTVLIFLPVVLLSLLLRINRKSITIILLIGFFAVLARDSILFLFLKYARVVDYFFVSTEGGERYFLVLAFTSVLLILSYNRVTIDPFSFYAVLLLPFLYYLLNINAVLTRASWYYQLFLITSIPKIIKSYKKTAIRICLIVAYFCLFGYLFLSTVLNNTVGIDPYHINL